MSNLREVEKPEYDLMSVEEIVRSSDQIVYRVYKPDVALNTAIAETAPMNVVYSIRDWSSSCYLIPTSM